MTAAEALEEKLVVPDAAELVTEGIRFNYRWL